MRAITVFAFVLLCLDSYAFRALLKKSSQNAVGWSTNKNQIISPSGSPVILKSIAWFGFETSNFVVHGIWTRKMEDLLHLIKNLGFNSIRIPWSNDIINNPTPNGINYGANPNLVGKKSLEVLDYMIDRCQEIGLWVILDRHRPDQNGQSELWYTDKVPESKWINDWKLLAERYKNKDIVIGADLHNEPHGKATWGTSSPSTDWNKAAERVANELLNIVPKWLFIVEGIENANGDYYWWGGNIQQAAQHQINLNVPNKVVYSPHDYGPGVYNQTWFNDPNFPRNLDGVWSKHWAFLSLNGIAPVWIGEFGGHQSDTSSKEGIWQNYLVDYIKNNKLSFSYWCLNPNSGDTGGILYDDWTTLDSNKVNMLKRILQ